MVKISKLVKSQKLLGVLACLGLFTALLSPVLPSPQVASAAESVSYPKLSDTLTYYESEFPSGLRYSPGWYGTFAYAPKAAEILLFDDVNEYDPLSGEWFGRCIFAMPVGSVPSGEQGGTSIKKISKAEADSILKSYPLDAYAKYNPDIAEVVPEKYLWTQPHAGEKLEQRWQIASQNKAPPVEEDGVLYKLETVEVEKELDGKVITVEETVKVALTEAQASFVRAAESEVKKLPDIELNLTKFDPPRYAILPAATTSLWSANTTWSATSGGATGASIPTNADEVIIDAASVAGADAVLSVDATAYCLSMDWTGATNTPTLAGSGTLNIYGNFTTIAAMVWNKTGNMAFKGATNITTNGLSITTVIYITGNVVLLDNASLGSFYPQSGTLDTNGKTISCAIFGDGGATTATTITLGASVINCTALLFTGTGVKTVTANTAQINISGTGACDLGDVDWNGASFNLTGTAHTVSGSPTGIDEFNFVPTGGTQTATISAGAGISAVTMTETGTVTIQSSVSGELYTLRGSTSAAITGATMSDYILADGDEVTVDCSGATGGTFAGADGTYTSMTVAGAGNYALTITGDNHIANLEVDASLAPKTIVNTGAVQTVDDFTRDTSTNVITLTNGTWNATGTTPIWLDYLTVSGSTATPDVWFAGSHSTDGGGNTGWRFDDPAINVETISATGITMDKDGVTGGTLTGNVTTVLRGTPRIPVHAEIGETAAYGTNVTGGTIYDNGLFTISVPANQTPGATYHYRMVGETGNASSPFNGADGTYTYTMPTFTKTSESYSTVNYNVTNMGAASSSYGVVGWGYIDGDYSNENLSNIAGIGAGSVTAIGFNPTKTVFARIGVRNGSITSWSPSTFIIGTASSNTVWGWYRLIIPLLVVAGLWIGFSKDASGLVLLSIVISGVVLFAIVTLMSS